MKKDFYIFQEDLIEYRVSSNNVSITEFVKHLNDAFCMEDMKKLRTEQILEYLIRKGFLIKMDDGSKIPSNKGLIMGIRNEEKVDREGNSRNITTYTQKGQQYILDHIYKMI